MSKMVGDRRDQQQQQLLLPIQDIFSMEEKWLGIKSTLIVDKDIAEMRIKQDFLLACPIKIVD